jgi:MFS family permease
VVAADRTGKGVRTAPRDALISFTSQGADLGRAFGVHRAMDTAGAMIGPLVAFALLAAAPDAYRTLFLISFFIAILGLGVITMLVREPSRERKLESARPDLKTAFGQVADRRFGGLLIAGTLALAVRTAQRSE